MNLLIEKNIFDEFKKWCALRTSVSGERWCACVGCMLAWVVWGCASAGDVLVYQSVWCTKVNSVGVIGGKTCGEVDSIAGSAVFLKN